MHDTEIAEVMSDLADCYMPGQATLLCFTDAVTGDDVWGRYVEIEIFAERKD